MSAIKTLGRVATGNRSSLLSIARGAGVQGGRVSDAKGYGALLARSAQNAQFSSLTSVNRTHVSQSLRLREASFCHIQTQTRSVSSGSSTSDDGAKASSAVSPNGEKQSSPRPAVMLIGWLMCKPRHLQKVEEHYAKLGFDTIAVAPPPQSLYFPKVG